MLMVENQNNFSHKTNSIHTNQVNKHKDINVAERAKKDATKKKFCITFKVLIWINFCFAFVIVLLDIVTFFSGKIIDWSNYIIGWWQTTNGTSWKISMFGTMCLIASILFLTFTIIYIIMYYVLKIKINQSYVLHITLILFLAELILFIFSCCKPEYISDTFVMNWVMYLKNNKLTFTAGGIVILIENILVLLICTFIFIWYYLPTKTKEKIINKHKIHQKNQ